MLIRTLTDRWLEHQLAYVRPKTERGYRTLLKRFNIEYSHREAESLRALDLDRFVQTLRAERKADATINAHLTAVRAMLRWAVKARHIDAMPCEIRMREVLRKRSKTKIKRAELKQLLSVAKPRERVLLLLLGTTGMRIDECLHLKWGDLDGLDITISAKPEVDWRPKNHAERQVSTVPTVVAEMNQYRSTLEHNGPDAWVFQSDRRPGQRLTTIFTPLRRVFQRAGLYERGKLAHELRRAAATSMIANGIDIDTVREVLGHRDVTTTQLYLQMDDERKRAAAASALVE